MIADARVLHPAPRQAVLELLGEHDYASKDDVAWPLLSLVEETELLVVDVSEAKFIDSSILHNLVRADRAARELGSSLRLQVGTTPVVRRVLELSELLDRLDCVSSREEALASRMS